MKKLFTAAIIAALAFGAGTFTACSKYDDSELRRLLEEQKKRMKSRTAVWPPLKL